MSTSDAVSNLVEYIYTALNKKEFTLSVFIDIKKDFDTVKHNILLEKLSVYGVRGLPLELLRSYLSERLQCVEIGNSVS